MSFHFPLIANRIPNEKHCQNKPFCHHYPYPPHACALQTVDLKSLLKIIFLKVAIILSDTYFFFLFFD